MIEELLMIKELFEKKRQYLNQFFDSVDINAAEHFLQLLLRCRGMRIFTGVGKSGLVAKKIALTMTSTGSRALYISPTNALHGDIGILSPDDICVMLSKSGESEELLNLVPILRSKGVKLLSIISKPNSRIAKASDFSIMLPVVSELCPYNIAPTTSTATHMIFGDIMAIALMRNQNFSLEQFVENHPGGSIGKRILIKVSDLMLKGSSIPLCKPEDTLMNTLVELSNKRCGCVLIVNEEMILQGIFTDGDLRRALLNKGPQVMDHTMQSLMTTRPRHIGPHKLAWEAMQVMEADQKNAITCLPVMDEERKVLGIIRLHDIVQAGL